MKTLSFRYHPAPRALSRAAALAASCLVSGCFGGDGGGGGGDGGVAPATGYVAAPATVEATVRRAVEVGCGRLFAECSYVCSQPFAACGPDEARCVDDFVSRTLDDYDHPVVDRALLDRCIDDVRDAACVDLPPSTVACDALVVEGCPGDADAFGTPYSVARAVEGALPGQITLSLCDRVGEWFAIELPRGGALEVGVVGAAPSIGYVEVELFAAPATDDDEPFDLQRELLRDDDEVEAFDPVDVAGRYLIEVTLDGQPTAEVVLSAQVVEADAAID